MRNSANQYLTCLFIERMAVTSDVRDILDLETDGQDEFITKDALFNADQKNKVSIKIHLR